MGTFPRTDVQEGSAGVRWRMGKGRSKKGGEEKYSGQGAGSDQAVERT